VIKYEGPREFIKLQIFELNLATSLKVFGCPARLLNMEKINKINKILFAEL